MTDKLYHILTEPKRIKSKIKRISERIEDTRLMMLPSGIRYDMDKIISSPSDQMLKFAEKLDELDKEKQKLTKEYFEARDYLFELVDNLSDETKKDIIQNHFILNKKFYQIAERIQYSEAQTYRLYADAIEELENMIVNDSKHI